MFVYNLLGTLTVLFGVILLISFVLFIISGGDSSYGLIALISVVLLFASMYGEIKVAEKNTTTEVEIVQMEVNKCDIADGEYKTHYYLTVDNEYIIGVTAEEYAKVDVGDMVDVEIVTKTVFGEVQKPNISLK